MPTAVEPAVAEMFSALGDPVRCAIVEHLSSRDDATVNEIAALFPISVQAVSKHIKVLEAAGVVAQRRDGRHRPVSLRREGVTSAGEWLERRRRQLDARYERLDALLVDLQKGTPR